ncbi:MAG: hypothetical protein LUC35_02760 [Clostridiales bacterium]|nr:hypothetical protein [Clostridiales bacterium]
MNEGFYIVTSLSQIPQYIKQCFPGLATGRYLGFPAGIGGKKSYFPLQMETAPKRRYGAVPFFQIIGSPVGKSELKQAIEGRKGIG